MEPLMMKLAGANPKDNLYTSGLSLLQTFLIADHKKKH